MKIESHCENKMDRIDFPNFVSKDSVQTLSIRTFKWIACQFSFPHSFLLLPPRAHQVLCHFSNLSFLVLTIEVVWFHCLAPSSSVLHYGPVMCVIILLLLRL